VEELPCPKCRKTGMVSLDPREDFEPPSVESFPDGFKIADIHFGPVFSLFKIVMRKHQVRRGKRSKPVLVNPLGQTSSSAVPDYGPAPQ
jgi:hypothetical protein